jgi:hypothetical protein
MQFLDCKITLSFSNQKNKDRSETLINKGKYEVKLKFIVSLIIEKLSADFRESVFLMFQIEEILKKRKFIMDSILMWSL